jgi:hypothetical protein
MRYADLPIAIKAHFVPELIERVWKTKRGINIHLKVGRIAAFERMWGEKWTLLYYKKKRKE